MQAVDTMATLSSLTTKDNKEELPVRTLLNY